MQTVRRLQCHHLQRPLLSVKWNKEEVLLFQQVSVSPTGVCCMLVDSPSEIATAYPDAYPQHTFFHRGLAIGEGKRCYCTYRLPWEESKQVFNGCVGRSPPDTTIENLLHSAAVGSDAYIEPCVRSVHTLVCFIAPLSPLVPISIPLLRKDANATRGRIWILLP